MKQIYFKILLRIIQYFYYKMSRTYYGVYLIPRPFDATYRFSFIGAYGMFLMKIISKKSCGTFLDIGANQGLFSILALKNRHIKRVIAFEPNPIMCDVITQNIELNSLTESDFCLVPAGISSETKSARLSYDSLHSGISKIEDQFSSAQALRVGVWGPETLHQYFRSVVDRQFGIKIDVEGYEEQVVEALSQSGVLSKTSWLIIELDQDRADFKKILELLHSNNLELVSHNAMAHGRHGDYLFEYK